MSMLRPLSAGVIALATAFVLIFAVSTMAQSGGIRGKVRDAQGRAIPNATVAARQEGEDIKTVRTDRKGDFRITGLRQGTYNVAVEAEGFASGVRFGVEVKNSVVNIGDRLILNPDLGNLVLVRGSVFFKEGRSVTGARVEMFEVGKDGSLKNLGSTYTNVSGDFTFRFPEREATLRIRASYRGVSGTKDIEVDMRGIYRTAITLDLSAASR